MPGFSAGMRVLADLVRLNGTLGSCARVSHSHDRSGDRGTSRIGHRPNQGGLCLRVHAGRRKQRNKCECNGEQAHTLVHRFLRSHVSGVARNQSPVRRTPDLAGRGPPRAVPPNCSVIIPPDWVAVNGHCRTVGSPVCRHACPCAPRNWPQAGEFGVTSSITRTYVAASTERPGLQTLDIDSFRGSPSCDRRFPRPRRQQIGKRVSTHGAGGPALPR